MDDSNDWAGPATKREEDVCTLRPPEAVGIYAVRCALSFSLHNSMR